MKNWKTTLGGLLALVTVILQAFDVITPDQQAIILGGVVTYLGFAAKDFNVTGK